MPGDTGAPPVPDADVRAEMPMRLGRNDPCPCGSGRKFKNCHADRPYELPLGAGPASHAGAKRPAPDLPPKRRQCGGCTACCGPTLEVNQPYLVIARHETCPHLTPNGCSRWGRDLPELCRTYLCNYLVEPADIGVDERPDRCGAIVQRRRSTGTNVIETFPGGVPKLFENPYWGRTVRENLAAGELLRITFFDDPYSAETLFLKRRGAGIGCELTSCNAAGEPILVDVEPDHGRRLQRALVLPNQQFAFDAAALVAYLGHRPEALLRPSRGATAGEQAYHFRITQRQVGVLKILLGAPQHAAPITVSAR
jgi:hypothetical protein